MSKIILSYLFKTNLAAFRTAIFDDNTDKICRILDIERDCLNKQIDSDGNTALILAIHHASPLTVRLLLEQGAHPDIPNGMNSYTPLATIASKVHEDYYSYKAQRTLAMAKILLDHGAFVDKPSWHVYKDENDRDYYGKETPLTTAARKGNLPLVKLLVDRKANVNSIERQSQIRAIHFAVINGDEAMYDFLEKSGALTCSIVTDGNNNLLHWFCYKKENDKNINLLNKLLDKGCNIDAENTAKRTPLMLAAKHNMTETCRVLLKNRADLDKHDVNGNQAIDLAIAGSECSNVLLQHKKIEQVKCSPTLVPKEKVLWKKRLDRTRRLTTELSEIGNNQTSTQTVSAKLSDDPKQEEQQQTNVPPHRYIYPLEKRSSEELDKKYERIWDSFRRARPKPKISKNPIGYEHVLPKLEADLQHNPRCQWYKPSAGRISL